MKICLVLMQVDRSFDHKFFRLPSKTSCFPFVRKVKLPCSEFVFILYLRVKMSRSTRELLETVESQKATIAKYEGRFKDLVRSYKSLNKEKEALEKSLQAIQGQNVEINEDPEDELSVEDEKEARIKTLAASLATVTAERAKLETNFQEDRKKLVTEKREKEEKVAILTNELETLKSRQKSEMEEMKSKLILERYEREKSQSDNQMMMRELQTVIADERRKRES